MMTRAIPVGFAAAMLMVAAAGGALAAASDTIFIPNGGSDHGAQRRAGSHFSIVAANLARRCTDLSSQFNHAVAQGAGAAKSAGALPDYRQGVALCEQGRRQQGIDTLEAALREIGVIPHVTY
jgi:hypothetical protein